MVCFTVWAYCTIILSYYYQVTVVTPSDFGSFRAVSTDALLRSWKRQELGGKRPLQAQRTAQS